MKIKKLLFLLPLMLTFPGNHLIAGGSWSQLEKPVETVDQSGRNLGTLGILPNETLYQIIKQGLPVQINTMEDLERGWQFIASFAKLNRNCARMAKDDFISSLIAERIDKRSSNQLWAQNFYKIKDNNKQLRILGALIKAGVDINEQNEMGWTALMRASLNGHTNIVKLLLAHNADVTIKDSQGRTAIDFAKNEGIQWLLKQKAGLNQKDQYGFTPLVRAVECRHSAAIKILLQEGADVNEVSGGYQETALIRASSMYKGQEIVQILLQHGADINKQDHYGKTALMGASFLCHKGIVKLLLTHNADVTIKDSQGRTAIDRAKEKAQSTHRNYNRIILLLEESKKSQLKATLDAFQFESTKQNSIVSTLPQAIIDEILTYLKTAYGENPSNSNN